jgi:hypothetical protein
LKAEKDENNLINAAVQNVSDLAGEHFCSPPQKKYVLVFSSIWKYQDIFRDNLS